MIGIYAITHTKSGNRYVGSSKNIQLRWRYHKYDLVDNKHHSPRLQHAWNAHGESAFVFEIIEIVKDNSLLLKREQHYLDNTNSVYNASRVAGMCSSRIGCTISKEHRDKISAGVKKAYEEGRHASKKGVSSGRLGSVNPNRGTPLTKDHKAKIAAALIGNQNGKANLGMKLTEEQKAKVSAAMTGRPSPGKGIPRTQEVKDKIAKTNREKKTQISEETRQKISASVKAKRWPEKQ